IKGNDCQWPGLFVANDLALEKASSSTCGSLPAGAAVVSFPIERGSTNCKLNPNSGFTSGCLENLVTITSEPETVLASLMMLFPTATPHLATTFSKPI